MKINLQITRPNSQRTQLLKKPRPAAVQAISNGSNAASPKPGFIAIDSNRRNPSAGSLRSLIKILMELGKVRITSFVTVSAAAGYLYFNKAFDVQMILPLFGVFILACGSSALNHYQERRTDALMKRTASRPIPSGRISPAQVLAVVLIYAVLGLSILFFTGGLVPMLLGILALAWYNAIYTPMKKMTSLAVIPGALIGAIPPVIGWASAGGSALDIRILAVAGFFFIWQIPHFWLLLLIYDKQYHEAGFPTLMQRFGLEKVIKLTYFWIALLTLAAFVLPLAGLTQYLATDIIISAAGIRLLWVSKKIFHVPANKLRFAFMEINMFVLAVVILLAVDNLVRF